MAIQQLTVFLDPETYELLMALRREGRFSTDDDVVRSALHALHHEWQGPVLPARESAQDMQDIEVTDEIFIHTPCMTPQDFDT